MSHLLFEQNADKNFTLRKINKIPLRSHWNDAPAALKIPLSDTTFFFTTPARAVDGKKTKKCFV
jgi:hypothetical protein